MVQIKLILILISSYFSCDVISLFVPSNETNTFNVFSRNMEEIGNYNRILLLR